MDYFSLFIGFMLVAVGAIFFGLPVGWVSRQLHERRNTKREAFVDYKQYCTKCQAYVPDILEADELFY